MLRSLAAHYAGSLYLYFILAGVFSVFLFWLPILDAMRTDWFRDIRGFGPTIESVIRPLILIYFPSPEHGPTASALAAEARLPVRG